MRLIKRLRLDSAALGTLLTGLSGQLVLVVSGVLVARALGPHDRGQLALLVAIAVCASYVIALGTPTAVAFTIARDRSARTILRVLRRWIAAQLAIGFVVTAVAAALSQQTDSTVVAWLLIPAGAVSLIAVYYGLSVLQGQGRFTPFNILRLLPAILYAAGAVVIVVAGAESVTAFAACWSLGNALAAIALALVVARGLPEDGDAEVDVRAILAYGVKAQIGTTSALETFQVDQLLVGAIVGPLGLGYYVIATAFTNLPRFISQSLGMVAFPRVARELESGGAQLVARQALLATLVLAGGTIALLELTMSFWVTLFFGDDFASSVPVARIMLVSAFFMSLRRVLGDALRGANKPLPASIAEVVAWGAYAIAIAPMTLQWGVKGAAGALVFAAVSGFLYIAASARHVAVRMRQASPARD